VTQTFEVGQKVTYGGEDVTVTYGPYTSPLGFTRYVVRLEGGSEANVRDVQLDAIPESPKFAVGDKVTPNFGTSGSIVSGPFVSRVSDDVFWVVEGEDGKHNTHGTDYLTKVVEPVKVGDRVRVTDDDGGGSHRFVGVVGTVKKLNGDDTSLPYLVEFGDGNGYHGDENGRWNCRAVERVEDDPNTVTHDGVAYDITAQYSDNEGDTWKLKRFGDVVRCATGGEEPRANFVDLGYVARTWGPLTRV